MKRTIKSQVSLCMSLAVIIPTIIISGICFYIMNSNQEDTYKEIMDSKANNIISVINNTLNYGSEAIDLLSENEKVRRVFNDDTIATEMRNDLLRSRDAHDDIITVFYGMTNGNTIATVDEISAGFDPRKSIWYKQAMSNKGKVIITEPYEDVNKKGRYVVTIAKSVKNNNGEVTGVIGADITLKELSDIVANIKIGEDGFTLVTDANGNVLASKLESLIGKKSTDKGYEWINNITQGGDDFEKLEIEDEDYRVNIKVDDKTDYRVTSFIPVTEYNQRINNLIKLILIIIGAAVIVAIGTGYLLGVSLSKSITKIADVMKLVGEGDFTQNIKTKKKEIEELRIIGESFNLMADDMTSVVSNIRTSSEKLKDSSDNMLTSTQESSIATEEIAKTVQEIASSALNQSNDINITTDEMKKLESELDQSAKKGADIIDISGNVKEEADKGMGVINELKTTYEKNVTATDNTMVEVQKLAESSNEIINITKTLSQITEQTNLLALNASIEAARAGKHGDGFAVVANEVRKLAEDSAKSADKINDVLTNMQKNIDVVFNGIKDSKELNDLTAKSIDVTDVSFLNIIKGVNRLDQSINEMYSALTNAVGSKDVTVKKVNDVSGLSESIACATQQVSAHAEEQSASLQQIVDFADNLNELASNLQELISKFKI